MKTVEEEPNEILCFTCENYLDEGYKMCRVTLTQEFAFICEHYSKKGELKNG